MSLDELVSQRNYILNELKAYEELQLALEKIKRFNMENLTESTIKVYETIDEGELQEITDSVVAVNIDSLTDKLLVLSEQINKIKMGDTSEIS